MFKIIQSRVSAGVQRTLRELIPRRASAVEYVPDPRIEECVRCDGSRLTLYIRTEIPSAICVCTADHPCLPLQDTQRPRDDDVLSNVSTLLRRKMPWERPASVPVGRVWSRFRGRERDGKAAKMYQIRDVEEKWKKTCLDMMQETFLRDEPLCDVLGITNDPVSVATIRTNWERYVDQNVSLACFTDEDGEPGDLVGFNIILVKTADDEDDDLEKVQGEPWKKLLLTLIRAEELVNVFKLFHVDKYLTSSGLTVLPEYRGQNIGARLFEAREPLCKALGIEATATVFTARTSQVLASKCGFQELAELDYRTMLECGIDLTSCGTPTAKLMGIKFQ